MCIQTRGASGEENVYACERKSKREARRGWGGSGGGGRGICERNEQEKENLPAFHLHCQIDIGWPSIYLRPPHAAEYSSNLVRDTSPLSVTFSAVHALQVVSWGLGSCPNVQVHSRSRSTGTIQCFLCRLSCETCKSTLPHIFYLNRTFVIYIFSTLEQLVCPF